MHHGFPFTILVERQLRIPRNQFLTCTYRNVKSKQINTCSNKHMLIIKLHTHLYIYIHTQCTYCTHLTVCYHMNVFFSITSQKQIRANKTSKTQVHDKEESVSLGIGPPKFDRSPKLFQGCWWPLFNEKPRYKHPRILEIILTSPCDISLKPHFALMTWGDRCLESVMSMSFLLCLNIVYFLGFFCIHVFF